MKRRRGASLAATIIVMAGCSGDAGGDTIASIPAPTTVVTATTRLLTPTTTVAPAVPADAGFVRDPNCIVTVAPGDFLAKIVAGLDGVTGVEIQAENLLTEDHVLHPGDELDVCVGNDVDDLTGASRSAPSAEAVRRQQSKLNELFDQYRIKDLFVDGDSGPLTRQMLCTARASLGLPISATHMTEGSIEEAALFDATSLSIPTGAAVRADRWILIDKTCQVMFIGERGDRIIDIYPTSTGEPGFETRSSAAVRAFRYDPAVDTNGWHDSTNFPVEADNPLNGNMYKPIYFSDGQAIHGATFVPPDPQSKGCARLFPDHQDELIDWLGLSELVEPTWQKSDIGVTVTVQGNYRPIELPETVPSLPSDE